MSDEQRPSDEPPPPSEPVDVSASAAAGSHKRKRAETEVSGGGVENAGSPMPDWMTGQSPPRFVTLDDLMRTTTSLTKMALAHEIVVNDKFKLERPRVAENSLAGKVSDAMHAAFWQKLRADLEAQPPEYNMLTALLDDVKETLLSLLLPQHTKLRVEIDENFDLALIRQRLQHGDTELRPIADYIINVMGRLCAPARDGEIDQLRKEADIVQLIRGILTTLEHMHMDMANYTIQLIRPTLVQTSALYERQKFDDYLKLNPGAFKKVVLTKYLDGLHNVHAWLRAAHDRLAAGGGMAAPLPSVQGSPAKPAAKRAAAGEGDQPGSSAQSATDDLAQATASPSVRHTIHEAFVDLLLSDTFDNALRTVPETLLVDADRLSVAGRTLHILCVTATAVMHACAAAGADVAAIGAFKRACTVHARTVLDTATTTATSGGAAGSLTDRLRTALEALAQILCADVVAFRQKVHEFDIDTTFNASAQTTFCHTIVQLADRHQPVRKLIESRVRTFLVTLLDHNAVTGSAGSAPSIQVPPALSTVEEELFQVTAQILRLVTLNISTFGDIYTAFVQRLQTAPTGDASQ